MKIDLQQQARLNKMCFDYSFEMILWLRYLINNREQIQKRHDNQTEEEKKLNAFSCHF